MRGGKGKDTAIRVYASDFNIHTRTKNEECGLAATTTNPETSAVRLRPKSFEVQRDRDQTPTRGIDLRKEMEKANSRAGPSAMIPSALPSAGEVKVRLPPLSSPTTRSFGTMKRGESGEGDEDEDEGEWIILDMRDDAGEIISLRCSLQPLLKLSLRTYSIYKHPANSPPPLPPAHILHLHFSHLVASRFHTSQHSHRQPGVSLFTFTRISREAAREGKREREPRRNGP